MIKESSTGVLNKCTIYTRAKIVSFRLWRLDLFCTVECAQYQWRYSVQLIDQLIYLSHSIVCMECVRKNVRNGC